MSNRSIETSVGRELPGVARVSVELSVELGADTDQVVQLVTEATIHALLGVGLLPLPPDDEA